MGILKEGEGSRGIMPLPLLDFRISIQLIIPFSMVLHLLHFRIFSMNLGSLPLPIKIKKSLPLSYPVLLKKNFHGCPCFECPVPIKLRRIGVPTRGFSSRRIPKLCNPSQGIKLMDLGFKCGELKV